MKSSPPKMFFPISKLATLINTSKQDITCMRGRKVLRILSSASGRIQSCTLGRRACTDSFYGRKRSIISSICLNHIGPLAIFGKQIINRPLLNLAACKNKSNINFRLNLLPFYASVKVMYLIRHYALFHKGRNLLFW